MYALPAFALAAASIFHITYQTKYYIDDLGMAPRTFALSNALVRSIDLFSYPVAGFLVDNTFVVGNPLVSGRRKPFLFTMAPLVAAAYFMLYAAPAGSLPPAGLQAWYILVAVVYNAIPLTLAYYSLGAELTANYDEQARCVYLTSCWVARLRDAAHSYSPPPPPPQYHGVGARGVQLGHGGGVADSGCHHGHQRRPRATHGRVPACCLHNSRAAQSDVALAGNAHARQRPYERHAAR